MAHAPASSDGYILQRGFAASARLNLMHYLWKEQVGHLLHPKIDLPDHGAHIAEIGTGTGLWLLDLARTLPSSAQLDGFDISLAQCPPKEWLPQNVSMSVLDMLQDVPDHLTGRYDAIHVRHFLLVVRDNAPGPIIRNMLKMLKPGGFIQWGEIDFTTIRFLTAAPGVSADAIKSIYNFVGQVGKTTTGCIRERSRWPATLDKAFEANGLVDVSMDRYSYDQAYLPYQLDTALMTWEELTYMVLDKMEGDKGHIARDLILKAYEEGRRGAAWDADRVVVVGQKSVK